MTPKGFLSACSRYFGPWPGDKPGVADAVSAYVATKRPEFLAALWPIVRDSRPVGYGPPDMACLMEHAEGAAEYARTHMILPTSVRPMLEDNEPRATMAEVRAALAATAVRLAEKQEAAKREREAGSAPKAPKPFAYLDGVRWNDTVQLSPEFYDETITMEERMRNYAARYKGRSKEGRGGGGI